LRDADEQSRHEATATLASFGSGAAEHAGAVRRVAVGGDAPAAAAALRVLGSMGKLETRDGRQLTRILGRKFVEEPAVVRREGNATFLNPGTLRAPGAYANALFALGYLGPAAQPYLSDIYELLRRLEHDEAFAMSLSSRADELVPAVVSAIARIAPTSTDSLRSIVARHDGTCGRNAAAIKTAGVPSKVIGVELLRPLLRDSVFASVCGVNLIREWSLEAAENASGIRITPSASADSLFLSWALRRAPAEEIIRVMIDPYVQSTASDGSTRSWRRQIGHLGVLFRDTSLARQGEAELVRALQDGPEDIRPSVAVALSIIGRLPSETIGLLLASMDTTGNERPPSDDLFRLLLEHEVFTPRGAAGAEAAIAYNLAPLRDSLNAPAFYLAAMGEQPTSRVAAILELGSRKFVMKHPNRFSPDERGRAFFFPLQAERFLVDSTHVASLRLLAYTIAPGDLYPWVRLIGNWDLPEREELERTTGSDILPALIRGWDAARLTPGIRYQTGVAMAEVARHARWKQGDAPLLREAARRLRSAELLNESDAVSARARDLTKPDRSRYAWLGAGMIGLHASFWLLLILVYPRSAVVQSWFFWSPTVRKVFGFGYVNLLLVWNPYLKRRLFEPFRNALTNTAAAEDGDPLSYKEGLEVRRRPGSLTPVPIEQAIPEIRGHIVLEGPSGLGKTRYLRRLVTRAERPTVYIAAHRCEGGVIRAIQEVLPGLGGEEVYLLRLLHAGALDICIDGINEVSAETRVRIRQFIESSPRANVIVATQPLDWAGERPEATFWELQPLQKEQIGRFLLATADELAPSAELSQQARLACGRYLDEVFSSDLGQDVRAMMLAGLSNPMDLSVAASLLLAGVRPTLFQLRRQQYEVMAREYERVYQGSRFPLRTIAEAALQMRLSDSPVLPWDRFPEAITIMAQHRFVVRMQLSITGNATEPRYQFRHEKIADYFIACCLSDVDDRRIREHLSDPRIRGAYLTLAFTLSLPDAEKLERMLVVRAAEQGDHSLSDPYVRTMELRRRLAAAAALDTVEFAKGGRTGAVI
jgi:hypothetical protein